LDALDRLAEEYLERVEMGLDAIRSQLRRPPLAGQPADRRAVVHCHSALSHDSRGSLDEITDAARATDTELVMITEHPRSDLDVIADGFSGRKRGVLLVPGAETGHLLVFFTEGRLDYSVTQREMIVQAQEKGGMTFLSHLEEREDWELEGLTGTEIYNAHASFKLQKRLSEVFRPDSAPGLEKLVETLLAISLHPDIGLSAICETPHIYLRGWDRMLRSSRTTGIGANDSHANYTFHLRANEVGDLQIQDFSGRRIATLPSSAEVARRIPGGGITFRPDNYEASFRHVGTHLLLDRLNRAAIMECLSNGRCYVAFDWLANPTGFSFRWETDRDRGLMGDSVAAGEKPTLFANLPAPAELMLKRHGQLVASAKSDALEYRPKLPGPYRLEAYVELVGEPRPWIYSNPIYVT